MNIFELLNDEDDIVWRDMFDRISCPGDACPKECDSTCPIWCQTVGLEYLLKERLAEAITEFKKALDIAPDYKEAWSNMANAYGRMDNHLEANKAYKAAYELDKKYTNAIFGLIMSHKNLGQFDEAFAYCDKYEAIMGKEEADALRERVKEAKDSADE